MYMRRPFLPWWQWSLAIIRAMKCIVSCGPGLLLLVLALPLPHPRPTPNMAFPNHMCIHMCTHTVFLSCPISHTQSQAHIYQHTIHTCTEAHKHIPREKKLKGLLAGGNGDRTRHFRTGCQFSLLRSALCFRTDPFPFCSLPHPNAWWPYPS